jgi:hypothetical protein
MGTQKTIGLLLAVAGVGVMIYSRLIRVAHSAIPPSPEEVAASRKRKKAFGIGAVVSLLGLLLLLMP